MQNTNTIFHATKAVFDENMYPRCPDGSRVNIPAIETGVLPPPDSYLDRDNNIPPEDGDQPPPPLPAEIDPIWRDHGAFWPYVPNAPGGSGGFDSQPPSQPPSPGLSYQAPSSRHRSVTSSHHSSGNSRPRSTHSHPSTGNTGSRSQTLTEEGNPITGRPITPNTYDFDAIRRNAIEMTRASYTPRRGIHQNDDYPQEWRDGLASGKYKDIPWYDQWKRGNSIPVLNPDWVDPGAESSRAAAHCEALESPLAPRSLAIPQGEIASYPREWRDGARSGKYSYIPSYQGWHQGEQLELAQPEQSSPPDFVERQPHENPGPST